MDAQKRQMEPNTLQQFVQMQQQKSNMSQNQDKIKKHLENMDIDDPERILDQFLIDWQPIKRYPRLAIFNFILFVIFGIFGGLQLGFTLDIKEVLLEYKSVCSEKEQGIGKVCTITNFEIPEDMEGPVYIYYQMNNFFQASPEFSSSKSVPQLQGSDISYDDALKSCGDNFTTNEQMGKTVAIDGTTLIGSAIAIPCGLYAYTMFSDTFDISGINIDDSDIAWSIDREENYKMNPMLKSRAWIDFSQNQHFMVWMRPSPASSFRKFYGKVPDGIKAGTYTLTIANNFNSELYKSTVNFVATTLNAFGQKNVLGSSVLLVLATIFLISSIICFVKYLKAKENY